ncbi:MAG: glycosyltransferase [Salinivirgaceae bacterium]|nr:glycosyltransferase [Salinivirgaceae bacterium]
MKVLYLSAWYPHRYDAMSGLFVRKHAEAASHFCDVCVLYLMADEHVNQFDIVEQSTNSVREIYVYYPFAKTPVLRQLTKAVGYVRAFWRGFAVVRQKFGLPDVVQANVLTRSGVLAHWLKRKFGIPYIIVEHWSRYLPQNFNYKGCARKIMTRRCVADAGCVLAVSGKLREAMQGYGLVNSNFQLIDNVVDDFFFSAEKSKGTKHKFRFLHVSCFDERPKNVKGILRAVKNLSLQRTDFELILVGVGQDWQSAVDYAKELELGDFVRFTGELTPTEVCRYFAESDAFVMFSNYENAPVVISESLATGTPVISTNVGGIPDMVNEQCGILINPGDESALCEKMSWMIDNEVVFDAAEIRKTAQRYTYDAVGKRLYDIYQNLCQAKQ